VHHENGNENIQTKFNVMNLGIQGGPEKKTGVSATHVYSLLNHRRCA
jgi:hypothetical protein